MKPNAQEWGVAYKRRTAAAVAFVAVVILLAVAGRFGLTASSDRTLLLALAPPAALVPVASALTWLGDGTTRGILTALVALALLIRRDASRAIALVLIVTGGAALNSAVKALVVRPRPDLLRHLDHVTSAAFPSGHAANSAILYLALALLVPPRHRRYAVAAALLLACAIGISRVMLAVHWPSDVAAGWCLGIGWLLLWRDRLVRPRCGRSPG